MPLNQLKNENGRNPSSSPLEKRCALLHRPWRRVHRRLSFVERNGNMNRGVESEDPCTKIRLNLAKQRSTVASQNVHTEYSCNS